MTVSGTPQLILNNGGMASYTAGSGSNSLAFTYTLAAGQDTAKKLYPKMLQATCWVHNQAGNDNGNQCRRKGYGQQLLHRTHVYFP